MRPPGRGPRGHAEGPPSLPCHSLQRTELEFHEGLPASPREEYAARCPHHGCRVSVLPQRNLTSRFRRIEKVPRAPRVKPREFHPLRHPEEQGSCNHFCCQAPWRVLPSLWTDPAGEALSLKGTPQGLCAGLISQGTWYQIRARELSHSRQALSSPSPHPCHYSSVSGTTSSKEYCTRSEGAELEKTVTTQFLVIPTMKPLVLD